MKLGLHFHTGKIIFPILASLFLYACSGTPKDPSPTAIIAPEAAHLSETVQFISNQGDILTATFSEGHTQVTVQLPNGESYRLPYVVSASGVRYSDGRDTFWVYGDEASFWHVNRRLFEGKMESR